MCRVCHLTTVDQQAMIGVRDSWFEATGGPPPGNKLALERTMWQQPVDAGAISQRGKQAAADQKVSELLAIMKQRGCKEEFVPNPSLLLDGQVSATAVWRCVVVVLSGSTASCVARSTVTQVLVA